MTRLEVYLPKLDVFFLDGVRSRFAQGVETAFPFSHCPVQRTGSTPPVISPSAASLRDPHPVSAGSFKDGFLDINTPYSRYVLMLDLLVEQVNNLCLCQTCYTCSLYCVSLYSGSIQTNLPHAW